MRTPFYPIADPEAAAAPGIALLISCSGSTRRD